MNNSNIYIEVELLQTKIDQLRVEKEKMGQVFSNIEDNIKEMTEYWKGNSGEKAYNILSEYSKDFTDILDQLEKRIEFIENVLAAYKQMDNLIKKKMEENVNIEAF